MWYQKLDDFERQPKVWPIHGLSPHDTYFSSPLQNLEITTAESSSMNTAFCSLIFQTFCFTNHNKGKSQEQSVQGHHTISCSGWLSVDSPMWQNVPACWPKGRCWHVEMDLLFRKLFYHKLSHDYHSSPNSHSLLWLWPACSIAAAAAALLCSWQAVTTLRWSQLVKP